MRITIATLITLLLATATQAQVTIAPEAGINLANMTIREPATWYQPPGTRVATSVKAGLSLGAIIEIPLWQKFFFQPGLFYAMNGCKVDGSGAININTLQLPLSLGYRSGRAGRPRFVASAGLFIAYNISGTTKNDSSSAPRVATTPPLFAALVPVCIAHSA